MPEKRFGLDKEYKYPLGMKVPEGYFEEFSKRMADKLPFNEAAETVKVQEAVRRTWWQRSRPYVYMAAMFAGIWCMTHMFSLMKTDSGTTPLETNATLTAALNNQDFVDDYVYASMSEYDMLDNLYEGGCILSD